MLVVSALGCGDSKHQPSDGPGLLADAPDDVGSAEEDDAPVQTGIHSGTRLQLVWQSFADGSRALDGRLRDAVRDELCLPTPWTDGHIYCSPMTSASPVYADSSCMQKIAHYGHLGCAALGPSDERPAYVAANDETYRRIVSLWSMSDDLQIATYWTVDAGTCRPHQVGPYDRFAELGADVPPTSLVELDVDEPPQVTRLRREYYVSADGVRAYAGLRDSELLSECDLVGAPGAPRNYCIPTATTAWLDAFADTLCTEPIAERRVLDGPPTFVAGAGTCSTDPVTLFAAGVAYDGSPYTKAPDGCQASSRSPELAYVRPGVALDPATLALDRSFPGMFRLRRFVYASSDGFAVDGDLLYDSQLHTPCSGSYLFGDFRCVALGNGLTTQLYTNPDCTGAINVFGVKGGPQQCAAAVPAVVYTRPPPTQPFDPCSFEERREVLGPHAGALFQCDGEPAPATDAFYDVGPALQAGDFVSAMLTFGD
jgi:hypothetical protein